MKPKLYIIGSNGIPARYGGFETFAENISIRLSDDYQITVVCSKYFYNTDEQKVAWKNIQRRFIGFRGNGFQSLIYDFRSLWIASKKADFILLLGVGAGIFLPLFSVSTRRTLVVHIDGLEWMRPKWNFPAKVLLRLGFLLSLRYAHSILIDNSALQAYAPAKYHSKLKQITYGGDHLPQGQLGQSFKSRPYALAIARAEPENNLHLILKAFNKIDSLDLVIISNWQQTRYGRVLHSIYRHRKNMLLTGPVYNQNELQKYRDNCVVYIHGHCAGGTNPSLVEAMYSGIPVFACNNEFNRTTTNGLAYYFKSEEELIQLISECNSSMLEKNAQQLKAFAQNNYEWKIAAESLKQVLTEMIR
jgi:glycosyltransferase involved in cell wall biosynthesis